MDWCNLCNGLIDTLIYSAVGIIMMVIAFLVICLVSPFSMKKEIAEDQNVAVGIIIGAVIIGVSIIIAAVISSPSGQTDQQCKKPCLNQPAAYEELRPVKPMTDDDKAE